MCTYGSFNVNLTFEMYLNHFFKTVTESQLNKVPSEIELSLRREASTNNEPTFTKIAYNVSTENEKKNYRIALAEYFCKYDKNFTKIRYIEKKNSKLIFIFILRQTISLAKLQLEEKVRKL